MNVNNKPRNGREKKKQNTKYSGQRPPRRQRAVGRVGRTFALKRAGVMEKQAGLGTDQAWQRYAVALKLSDSHWSYCSRRFVCLCHLLSPVLECR